jgi:hypothetical protein
MKKVAREEVARRPKARLGGGRRAETLGHRVASDV